MIPKMRYSTQGLVLSYFRVSGWDLAFRLYGLEVVGVQGVGVDASLGPDLQGSNLEGRELRIWGFGFRDS